MKELLTKKYGTVVEGPLGFHVPERIARSIEAAQKSLPAGMGFRRVGKSADIIDPDLEARTEISVITTSAVDRDDEVVLPAGGDWAEFKRNPVVTFDHNYDEPPVGTCQWIKAKGEGLIAKTLYPTKPADWGDAAWMPSAVWHLMNQDPPVCTGKSVGFMPTVVRKATSEEISRRPELKGLPIISNWIGLEYAVTPMPCNPEAGMIAVSKSADVDEHAIELVTKSFALHLNELKKKAMPNLADAAEAAMQEAAANVAAYIPYYTMDEFKYALLRRLDFTDEHKETIQTAIVDAFDKALGLV